MQMKRKLCALLALMMLLASLAGCSGEKSPEADGRTETTAAAAKGDGYDKFLQLEIGMTEAQVNAILGEPVRVDKAYYYYTVTVNGQDMELEVWINIPTGQVSYLYGDFGADPYRSAFADKKTDLSAASKLESGDLTTYDDCAAAFKTPGYLTCVDEDGMKIYLWVDSDGGYMRVTFFADGTVKGYNGFC